MCIATVDRDCRKRARKDSEFIYETEVWSIYSRAINRGAKFAIDIGANYGVHSVKLAGLLSQYQDSHLYSFEANWRTFEQLKYNIVQNDFEDKVSLYNHVLFNESRHLWFENRFKAGQSRIVYNESQLELLDKQNVVKVKTKTVDSIIPKNQKIQILKVDVEGADCHTILGSLQTIENNLEDILILTEYNKYILLSDDQNIK